MCESRHKQLEGLGERTTVPYPRAMAAPVYQVYSAHERDCYLLVRTCNAFTANAAVLRTQRLPCLEPELRNIHGTERDKLTMH